MQEKPENRVRTHIRTLFSGIISTFVNYRLFWRAFRMANSRCRTAVR